MATLTRENAVFVLVVKVISVSLTGVNEELVGDSWVVDVVNCTGENGSKNFKVCENRLKEKNTRMYGQCRRAIIFTTQAHYTFI